MPVYTFTVPCVKRTYATGATKPPNGTTWAVGSPSLTAASVQPNISRANSGSPTWTTDTFSVTFTATGAEDVVYATVVLNTTVSNYAAFFALSLYPNSGFDDTQPTNIWYVCRVAANNSINAEVLGETAYAVRPFYVAIGVVVDVLSFSWTSVPSGATTSGDNLTFVLPVDVPVAQTFTATLNAVYDGGSVGLTLDINVGNLVTCDPLQMTATPDDDTVTLESTQTQTDGAIIAAVIGSAGYGTFGAGFKGNDVIAAHSVDNYHWAVHTESPSGPLISEADGNSLDFTELEEGDYYGVLTITDEWGGTDWDYVPFTVESAGNIGTAYKPNGMLHSAVKSGSDVQIYRTAGAIGDKETLGTIDGAKNPSLWRKDSELFAGAQETATGDYHIHRSKDDGRTWEQLT